MDEFFGRIAKLIQIQAAQMTGDYRDGNASLYDLVEQYSADIPFYVENGLRMGGPVLELGCGTGRVLIPLARAGVDVTGLDLSPDMLSECRRKLDLEPEAVSSRVTLVQGDMRVLSLPGRFRLVLLPLYTFVHMTTRADKLACLSGVAAHLEPGGTLLMEVELDGGYREAPAPVLNIVRRDRETGTLLLVLHQSRREPDGSILLNLLNIVVDRLGQATLSAVSSRESRTTPGELSELLDGVGLCLEAAWGDCSGSPLAADARGAVIRARRPPW
ncbi:MAG: class I SAM-dependent methyltransferase [Bacillota bacterium]|nr:class I SAM-dependent methyltransferase [Bacillota bacterium]